MINKKKVLVFFGCSMRGGHEVVSKEELAKFPEIIEELGCVLASKHQTEEGIIAKEDKLDTTNIHDRDYEWEMESDVGVFEISNGSIGTGEEISDMVCLGKPVLCLYKKEFENDVSAYGRGKQGSKYVKTPFECHSYSNLTEAKNIIALFIETYV